MENFEQQLDTIVVRLREELLKLRTGRATPALVEDIAVDYYGAKTSLKALAAISVVEPRQLFIQPWDRNALPAIERALAQSQLGVNPIAERDAIRIALPPLTEERRKELSKLKGKFVEGARIETRQARDEVIKEVERQARDREIGEDERFRRKHEAQKMIDETNRKIEELSQAKEKEIMAI